MGLQTLLVFLSVALASAYFVRSLAREVRGDGCASGCGRCASRTCRSRKLVRQKIRIR